jgi:hypothetical protein
MQVHISYLHKQAQLSGIIVVTKKKKMLGTHVSTYSRTVETNLAFQSASTEAILEICMRTSLCAEKKSVTTPSASNQGY